jgi:hypothetical protein
MLHVLPAARSHGVGQAPGYGRLKVTIPTQVQHVDVSATLNEPLAPACLASHTAPFFVAHSVVSLLCSNTSAIGA